MALGLPTVLGLKPRGWFIPHRYAALHALRVASCEFAGANLLLAN